MNKERIEWDQYFMLQAILLSTRSTCNRLSVGSVLVRDKRIIAGGYNGSVSKDDHCIDKGCYLVDGHCVRTIHAEMNAILQCAKFGEITNDAEIYVTDFPCLQCTKMLVQAGVKKINYLRNYNNDDYALKLLEKMNIKINQIKIDDETIKKIPFDNFLSN
ncbi:ComE operon protein 2 [Lactobacillus sp. S2-2]|uniref:ComE operon protein 2 n=1 Tax=Lactobacillus sp. S2-2 TaxID=2692917 RepID=UPI001F3C65C8|nr:ComE operon protein 2 [Lactobacillus sp. S2-2]MCF6514890.1 ComE operon protein 2 [Lactobacillus sp. S2-2]